MIQAADNAYQQRLALVETTGVVLPQGVPSQDQAAASGAAGASSSAADWLRPPTPPSASSWLQDSRTPLPRIRPSAEERQAAKSIFRGVYAKAAETRRESSRERSTQRSRSPSPRRSRSPSSTPRRGPTAAAPVEQRAHSVEPALAREGRPSRTSLATRPIVLAPQNSIYPVTRFDEHGIWVLVREASQPREAAPHRRAQRTSGQLRQANPYLLADETWRDPPRRSSTSSRSRSPDRRPAPAEHFRLDACSSDEEPPQDAESIRSGRAAYVPRRVYEAPTHSEPIALHSRRIGAVQPPPRKAAPKVIFGSKPPLPKEIPRAVSLVPAKADIPRKSPPWARSPVRTQSAFGHKAPPRGLSRAEPRSKSSSNPPQFGYIVKPPPPQVVQAAAASAATSEAGSRFRSPPRRTPPAPPPPPPPPGRPVPPKELVVALDWHGVLDVGQQGPHLNPEVIRHLVQFAADYAPINFIVLSFVGRAASEYRRREFQVALEHARTTSGLTFSAIKKSFTNGWVGEAKQTPFKGWAFTPLLTIQHRLSVKLERQASRRSATSRTSGRADLPTHSRTSVSSLSPGTDNSFRRQGACIHRSTSRSSTDLHPSCPPAGYFDSHCCKPLKPSLCAVQHFAVTGIRFADKFSIQLGNIPR